MAVKIENLTNKPIWLRLNSGMSLSIAARGNSNELPAHEVDDNAQLDKLVQRGVIARTSTANAATLKDAGDKPRARRSESAA